MQRPVVVFEMTSRISVGLVLGAALLCHAASAQTPPAYNPASQVDGYGNARAVWRRYPRELYPTTDVRSRGVRGFGRRTPVAAAAPGTLSRSAFPGGVLAQPRSRSTARSTYPFPATRPSSSWPRRGFESAGGFRRADPGRGEQAVLGALERRYVLVGSRSLNAPVYQAMLRTGTGFARRTMFTREPAARFALQHADLPVTSPTLGGQLRSGADAAARRRRAEGWRWFREGRYHVAARAFESAALARADDIESTIGELFCHVSLRAMQTAVTVLSGLNRRNANPFVHTLNMIDAYGDPARAREVLVAMQLRAGSNRENPDVAALYALMLWYLGRDDEALSIAEKLARDFPGVAYADWADKMRAAETRRHGE